jgi:hypothetical protein
MLNNTDSQPYSFDLPDHIAQEVVPGSSPAPKIQSPVEDLFQLLNSPTSEHVSDTC